MLKKVLYVFFKYGDLPFNYGFIPQTWEDPNQPSRHADASGLKGDNDPLDVVEISGTSITRGDVLPVKVISVLGLIDEGEADWKLIAIRADHPHASEIHSIKDAERILETRLQEIVVDWFQKYKVPDGKAENRFTHNAKFQSPEMALEVIEDGHRQWHDLIVGTTKSENSLESLTRQQLLDQDTDTNSSNSRHSKLIYPTYDNWKGKKTIPNFTNKKYHLEQE